MRSGRILQKIDRFLFASASFMQSCNRDDLPVSPGKRFDRPVLTRCPRVLRLLKRIGLKSHIRLSGVLVKSPSITSSDASTHLRPAEKPVGGPLPSLRPRLRDPQFRLEPRAT